MMLLAANVISSSCCPSKPYRATTLVPEARGGGVFKALGRTGVRGGSGPGGATSGSLGGAKRDRLRMLYFGLTFVCFQKEVCMAWGIQGRPVREGVSKEEEDGRRPPAQRAYKGRAWWARMKL
jgi:hypothetical protein